MRVKRADFKDYQVSLLFIMKLLFKYKEIDPFRLLVHDIFLSHRFMDLLPLSNSITFLSYPGETPLTLTMTCVSSNH